jgi:DNA-3-methyladenine glycosylase II
MERTVTTLTPTSPYDFDLTGAYATYFRGHYGADWFKAGVFRRLLDLDNRLCLASVRSLGTMDSPSLEVELQCSALNDSIVSEAQRQVARLLGIDQDLAPFYQMAYEDPFLAKFARELRGLHIPQTVSVWEALVFAILGQQISTHMARMLRTLFTQIYGSPLRESGITYHAFPRPEAISQAGVGGLRSIKLSKRKAQFIVDIAGTLVSGERNLEGLRALPDEEIIRSLTSIPGVGSWTAQWMLIRAFCRPDAFPNGDLALRRYLGLLLNCGSPLHTGEALHYAHGWSPFRSYVTTYVFAAARSGRFQGFP